MKKYLLFVFFVFLNFSFVFGQAPLLETEWEEISIPGASARSFVERDGRMWIANNRLYYSDDEGVNWQQHPDFPPTGDTSHWNVYATSERIMIVQKTNSGFNSLFSEDNGNTFISVEGGTHTLYQKSANELVGFHNYSDELLGESYLVFRTLDAGETWEEYTLASSGVYNGEEITTDKHYFSISNDTIADLTRHEEWDTVYYELALSQELDTTFTVNLIPPDSFGMNVYYQFWYDSGKVYLSHPDSFVVVSSDLGVNWSVLPSPEGDRVHIRHIRFNEHGIYWNLESGLWVTNYEDLANPEFIFDPGSTFTNSFHSGNFNLYSTGTNVYLQSPTIPIPELRENGIAGKVTFFNSFGQVWWVKAGGVLFRSIDEGLNWERELSPIVNAPFSNLKVFEDFENILYVYTDSLIYASTDDGVTWDPISNLTFGTHISVEKNSEGIYFYGNGNILFSTGGIVFKERMLPGSGQLVFDENESKLYLLRSNRRYVSTDQGNSWSPPEIIYGERGVTYQFHTGQLWSEVYQFDNSNLITLSNDFGKTWIDYLNFDPIGPLPGNSILFRYTDVYPEIGFVKTDSRLYVTCNIGRDFGHIRGPFNSVSQYTGFEYPIPQNSLVKGDFLYGYDSGGGLYRTSLIDLKNQLSDTLSVHNQISGFLYSDDNDNCVFDEDDRPIKDKVITLGDRITTTDENGWYGVFHTAIDSIDFYTDSLRYHLHNCEFSYSGIKILSNEFFDTLSIAFDPILGINDGGLTVWPMGIFRPNGRPFLKVNVTNHGTEDIINQDFTINFNPEQQGISTASSGTLINDSTWQYSIDLMAGENQDYWLKFHLNQDLAIDDTLNYQIEIPITNDEYPADNTIDLEIPVLSSFDPNDKAVFPANTPRPGETTELVYRIRFQNTGTDTAFNVTVIDTLSENLNLFSLRILETSHPYELQIDAGNIVRWNFNNILLPDSTTNEPESHGFIYFKINTKNNLIDGDQIPNLAAIYFDFNDPILTNQVVTEIKDILINTEDLSTLPFTTQLQPNPTSHAARLVFELEKPEKLEINLFNELGQKVTSVLPSQTLAIGEQTIEFSLLSVPSGIYFLTIKTETGTKTIRVVKVE